ncbi:MAG: hypothetical protein WBB70_12380 [Desulfobacterales bacterium]
MGEPMNPDVIIIRCNHCGTKNRIPKNRLVGALPKSEIEKNILSIID